MPAAGGGDVGPALLLTVAEPAAILLSLGGGAKEYDLLYALPDGRGAWARAPFSR
jgi:hypothetical protein